MKKFLLLMVAVVTFVFTAAADISEPVMYGIGTTVESDEDLGDSEFPLTENVKVKMYENSVVIENYAGVDGYGMEVGFDEDDNVTYVTPIKEGEYGEQVTSGYAKVYTGLTTPKYANFYVKKNYAYASYDKTTGEGYVLIYAYIGADEVWGYYWLEWEKCDEPTAEPGAIYVIGDMGACWDINDTSNPLVETEVGSNVYKGKLNIIANSFRFRFYSELGDWQTGTIGAAAPEGSYNIEFTDGKYTGECVPGGFGNWWFPNWPGGEVELEVDLNNNSVVFTTDVDTEVVAPTHPDKLYLIGGMQNWDINNGNLVLEPVEEGSQVFKIQTYVSEGEDINFRFYSMLNYWDKGSIGAAADDNVPVDFVDGKYNGTLAMDSQKCWTLTSWPGGMLEMTVNLEENTVMFEEVSTGSKVIYLVGAPQGWNISSTAMVLEESAAAGNVFTGKFEIPEDQFMFRFYSELGNWDANSIGSQGNDSAMEIAFTDGEYTGDCVVGGKGSWTVSGWTGGEVEMTVDLNTNTVAFKSDADIPVVEPTTPEKLYLIGGMQDWNINGDNFVLEPVAEGSTTYKISTEIEAGRDIYFRFYSELGDWNKGSVGCATGNTYVELNDGKFESTLVEGSQDCWILGNWPGGKMDMTVDLEAKTVLFESDVEMGEVLRYSAYGETYEDEEYGDSFFPWVRNVLVDAYDTYIYVNAFAGVEGYDMIVAFDEEENVTSITPVVNGVKGETVTAGYANLKTGLDDPNKVNAYVGEGYAYACSYPETGEGYLILFGYMGTDQNYGYYYLAWPQEPFTGAIYLVGAPQGWNIDHSDMALIETEEGSNVYKGTFDIPADQFQLRFYTELGDWETNSIGSQGSDNPIDIELVNDVYEGECVNGKGTWRVPGWEGGEVTFVVDLENYTVKFYIGEAGVEMIENADAEAVYFNLNGVRVNADNLDKGIYIVREGNKTHKVLVK